MPIATEPARSSLRLGLTDFSAGGTIRAYMRVTTADPAPLHSCQRCITGSQSATGSHDPEVPTPVVPTSPRTSPSERGSE
jgi:hypothetical protein